MAEVGVGTVSSARVIGERGAINMSDAKNALDVLAEERLSQRNLDEILASYTDEELIEAYERASNTADIAGLVGVASIGQSAVATIGRGAVVKFAADLNPFSLAISALATLTSYQAQNAAERISEEMGRRGLPGGTIPQDGAADVGDPYTDGAQLTEASQVDYDADEEIADLDLDFEPEGPVSVTTNSYDNGVTTTTTLDSVGNGVHTISSPETGDVSYTISGNGLDMPVVLDLDGDGIEIFSGLSSFFDWDGDGFKELGSWVSSDDGFLVIDLNEDGSRGGGDGQIDQARELVLSLWGNEKDTDLQALARAFDDNGDGVLDAQDDIWSELRVWQDLNEDGVTDAGELFSLSGVTATGWYDVNGNGVQDAGENVTLQSLDISSIGLTYDDGSSYSDTRGDVIILGNRLLGSSSLEMNNQAVTGGVGDVALRYRDQGWRRVETGIGYDIEFEGGGALRYSVLTGSGTQHVDLDDLVLDGVTGDDRSNELSAQGHSRSVQISGGAGNDSVWGGANDDMLAGDAGADDIRGHDGNDVLFVDAQDLSSGNVSGGAGIDTLIATGSTSVNVTLFDHAVEAAYGSDGGDVFSGAGLYDDLSIHGGNGFDTIAGGDANDRLSGDNGDDSISGAQGSDVILGGAGADTLNGELGDDIVLGGYHNDFLQGSYGDDRLNGGGAADTLYGGSQDDILDGGAGTDVLGGGYGDDLLLGAGGNDELYFWRGDDTLFGQNGDDTFYLKWSQARYDGDNWQPHWGWVQVFGGRGLDTLVLNDSSYEEIRFIGGNQWQLIDRINPTNKIVVDLVDIERVQLADGTIINLSTDTTVDTNNDYIRSNPDAYLGDSNVHTGKSQFYVSGTLSGWTGNDAISGGLSKDTIDGGQGQDTIAASGQPDTVYGGSGSDSIDGGDQSDLLFGNSGSDILSGGTGNDTLEGQQGADQMWGDDGNDSLIGGTGGDYLDGGLGSDTLRGDDGHDWLVGGADGDLMYAGYGADRLEGGLGADDIYGNQGSDELYGNEGNDTLGGGDGFDVIYGNAGDDSLSGGQDDDWLLGGDGADTLLGHNGRDVLNGGAGADGLNGGGGILDVANYEGSTAAVSVNLGTGAASGGDAQGDTISNIESLVGSDHSDNLTGSDVDNIIEGGKGADTISAGAGHDALAGGSQYDTIWAGDGDDRVWGENGCDTVGLGNGDDAFYDNSQAGQHGQDTVYGAAGNDEIFGGGGDDSFYGDAGSDTIIGGVGNDTLTGGGGADVFKFDTSQQLGDDVITDFVRGTDLLEMSGVTYSDLTFVGTGSGVRVEWDGGTVKLDGVNINDIDQSDFTFV